MKASLRFIAAILVLGSIDGVCQNHHTTDVIIKQVSYEVDDATIAGTLTYTEMSQSIALIIPGSGPTDRDGNNTMGLKTNAYKMISEALIGQDIASLRIDKRGIGESSPGFEEAKMTFDLYLDDFRKIIDTLRKQKYAQIYLIGHSEGALVASVLAADGLCDRVVLLAGMAQRIDEIILEQLGDQAPILVDSAQVIIKQLAEGKIVENVPFFLQMLFRPSVQPYLISAMRYSPRDEIAKIKVPTMIIHGTTDLQIYPSEASALAESLPEAKLLIIDDMNHVLKKSRAEVSENMRTYSDATLPLHPKLMPAIMVFLKD